MTGPGTAREALIVETLGEIAALIDRVEAVVPALDASRRALTQVSADLAAQVAAFEGRMAGITENAKVQAIHHIARRTDALARTSLDGQTRALEQAARELFRAEADSALQRIVLPLQQLANMSGRGMHPWQRWMTHAATAIGAAVLSWALAAWWWGR